MIISKQNLEHYFQDRDHPCVWYNPDVSFGCEFINDKVWYMCWVRPSDTLKSDYEYSSESLDDVLNWYYDNVNDFNYF